MAKLVILPYLLVFTILFLLICLIGYGLFVVGLICFNVYLLITGRRSLHPAIQFGMTDKPTTTGDGPPPAADDRVSCQWLWINGQWQQPEQSTSLRWADPILSADSRAALFHNQPVQS